MKTYQDFVAVGEDEKARMSFILGTINEYKADHSTRLAANANKYYHGENPTINKYEKIIYDKNITGADFLAREMFLHDLHQ